MNRIDKHDGQHDDISAAYNIRFEKVAETASKALLQHIADLNMTIKLIHLETESLREVKESLQSALSKTLKAELSTSATTFGSQLFWVFSGKAATFLDNQFAQVTRVNDDLKKTMRTWSNISLKSISLLALTAMLIGVSSFFVSYYFMPSQRLTQDEMNIIYYGKAYVAHAKMIHPEIRKVITKEANKLRQTIVTTTK